MYSRLSPKKQKSRRTKFTFPSIIITLVIGYSATMLLWPLGTISATLLEQSIVPANAPTLAWPGYGQSALYADGYGLLGTEGAQTPIPIASITKIITALTVLNTKPITDPANTPQITFSQDDVERYNRYLAQDGVVAPLAPGDTISQYDLMQIMLIASANNYAETLAVWAFGSVDAYLLAAKDYLASQGLSATTVMDPAGFSTGSSSTATDLALLGKIALNDATIAVIVAKPSVTVPDVGTFYTTNILITSNKAIGVKTGNTDEAGQCLLFAQRYTIDETVVTMTGAILGGESRAQVASSASALLDSGVAGFAPRQYAATDQVFATYKAPWGATANLVSKDNASAVVWLGDVSKVITTAPPITPESTLTPEAKATLTAGKQNAITKLSLDQPLTKPSPLWRLTHPLTVLGL